VISDLSDVRLDQHTAELASVLRTGLPYQGASPDLIGRADAHGVLPLLAWRCRARSAQLPRDLDQQLMATIAHAVAWDVWTAAELVTVLDAVRAAGVETMVIKGAALARQVYREPWLRPHGDIDLLVRPASLTRITDTLLALGYVQEATIDGTHVTQQAHFGRTDGQGVRHAVDVHWRIANPHAFAHALDFEELRADAIRILSLGGVLAPCAMHALLLALVHRAAHHYDNHRLIWLFDIHLLAEQLDAHDWERLVALTVERKLAAVALRGLELTEDAFGASWPPRVPDRLAAAPQGNMSAAFLDGIHRQVDVLASDLRALPDVRSRVTLLRQHLFPSRTYMMARYQTSSRWALPWLYARRIITGAPRWLRAIRDS
jgi:hypothetical protein